MNRPVFTLSEAADLVSASRSTLRRKLDQGSFPDAYRTSKGVWKVPLTNLLAVGFHPVQGAVQDLSTDIGQPVHDIAQSEQVSLRNRVVELESALSIERAHRTAAEQVAAAERHRAENAETALRMLESVIPRPSIERSSTTNHHSDDPKLSEDPGPLPTDEVAPKKPFWKRWSRG